MVERKEYYKVDDALPTIWVDKDGVQIPQNSTILEIVDLPISSEEIKKIVTDTLNKHLSAGRKGISILGGKNMQDNPKWAPHVHPDKLYVIQT